MLLCVIFFIFYREYVANACKVLQCCSLHRSKKEVLTRTYIYRCKWKFLKIYCYKVKYERINSFLYHYQSSPRKNFKV